MGTFKNPDVWKQNLAYQIGDFVLYDGSVYMAIKPVPAGTDMSADYWIAFAEGAVVPTTEGKITANGTYNVEAWKTAEVDVHIAEIETSKWPVMLLWTSNNAGVSVGASVFPSSAYRNVFYGDKAISFSAWTPALVSNFSCDLVINPRNNHYIELYTGKVTNATVQECEIIDTYNVGDDASENGYIKKTENTEFLRITVPMIDMEEKPDYDGVTGDCIIINIMN